MKPSAAGLLLLLLAAQPAVAGQAAGAKHCAMLLQERLKTDLRLTEYQFDQVDGQGWRRLAQAGCDDETIALIEAYTATHQDSGVVLTWHLAQAHAMADKLPSAIKVGRRALRQDEDSSGTATHWNSYVLGTIAFWEGDLETLRAQLGVLKTTPNGSVATDSLRRALELLSACSGYSYTKLAICAR